MTRKDTAVRRWSVDDDAALVATIDRTAVEVATLLGRTVLAVEARRFRLRHKGVLAGGGLSGPDFQRTWTPDEDAIVATTTTLPIKAVAEMIPAHTATAITLRRRELRSRATVDLEALSQPRRPRPWSVEDDAVIRDRMTGHLGNLAREPDRSLTATAKRREKLRARDARFQERRAARRRVKARRGGPGLDAPTELNTESLNHRRALRERGMWAYFLSARIRTKCTETHRLTADGNDETSMVSS